MIIYLIRHGDPDYEHDTLTPRGREEASLVAGYLADERITTIYSSPRGRAQDTAEYTAKKLGIGVTIEEWTTELGIHGLRPGPPTMAWDMHGHEIRTKSYLQSPHEYHLIDEFPAEETSTAITEIRKNSDRFLMSLGYLREDGHYLVKRRNTDRIALFAHGGFGLTWLSILLEIPVPLVWSGFFLHTTSVTQILFDERQQDIAVPRCLMTGSLPHLYKAGAVPSTAGIKANHE